MNTAKKFRTRHTMVRRELPAIQLSQKQNQRTTQRSWRSRYYRAQEGGAKWFDGLATPTDTDMQRRIKYWDQEMTERGVIEEFGFILETRNPDDAMAETDEQKTKKVDQYLKLIEQQDLLFDLALGAICRDLDNRLGSKIVPGDYDSLKGYTSAIDALRPDMIGYIKDVERLLFFGTDETINDMLGATKLQQIYTAEDDTLSSLLLYPWRLNNVFILSMAKLFVSIKDSDVLAEVKGTESLMKLLSAQWNSFFLTMVNSLTSRPPRDGFFLNQGEKDFMDNYIITEKPSGRSYWYNLVDQISKETNLFTAEGCKNLRDPVLFSQITASVFMEYKAGRLDTLLKVFESCDITTGTPKLTEDLTMNPSLKEILPEEEYWNTGVGRGSTATIRKILEQMNDATLQYMIHLAYTVKKQAEEAKKLGEEIGTEGEPVNAMELVRHATEVEQLKSQISTYKEVIGKLSGDIEEFQRGFEIQISSLQAELQKEKATYKNSPETLQALEKQTKLVSDLEGKTQQLTKDILVRNTELAKQASQRVMMTPQLIGSQAATPTIVKPPAPVPVFPPSTNLVIRSSSENIKIEPRVFTQGTILYNRYYTTPVEEGLEQDYANIITNRLYNEIQRVDPLRKSQKKQLVSTTLYPDDLIKYVSKTSSKLPSLYDGFILTNEALTKLYQDDRISADRKPIIVANAIQTLYSDYFTKPISEVTAAISATPTPITTEKPVKMINIFPDMFKAVAPPTPLSEENAQRMDVIRRRLEQTTSPK